MNTVSVNATQVFGVILGLLVIVAGIIVNLNKFGNQLTLLNMAVFIISGVLVVITMMVCVKD